MASSPHRFNDDDHGSESDVAGGFADSPLKTEEPPSLEAAEVKAAARARLLVISFCLMLFIGLGNKIFAKLQTAPMTNYSASLNILTTAIYLPTSFAYIWPMIMWGNQITKEQRAIPQYKFAVMGALDSLAGIMQLFATVKIPSGALIILLQQAAIPISMVISKTMLKAQYTLQHYVGSLIVCAGLVCVLLPEFLSPTPGAKNQTYWIATMILSCVPMTLSSVFKEKALGEVEVDPIYLNGYVAVYQLLFTIPLTLPSGYAVGVPINKLWTNIVDGFACYIGHNSIKVASSNFSIDDCAMAPIYCNIYFMFNLGFNILIVCILKWGSANVLWLALTVMVPFGNFAFALKFVPGHKPIKLTDVLGLVIIMTGLFIYRFFGKAKALVDRLRGKVPVDPVDAAAEQQSLLPAADGAAQPMATPHAPYTSVATRMSFSNPNSVNSAFASGILDARMARRQQQRTRQILNRDPARMRSGYFSRLGIAPTEQNGGKAAAKHLPLYNSLG